MPTAVLPPGLEALLRSARAPSYESPYSYMEGFSPEELAIGGMPEAADVMLKREAMAGQRAGLGGQHALGLSELAERSVARQIADQLSQQRLGLGFGELASRHQLGSRGLDLQGQELGLKDEMAQMADLIQRAKLGIEAQRVSQEGALGEGELAMRGRALEQQLMPNLLAAMGNYERGRGYGEYTSAKAAETMQGLGGGGAAAQPQESGGNNIMNALIAAGLLYGGYRGGKHLLGKYVKGANASSPASEALVASKSGPAAQGAPSVAETISATITQPTDFERAAQMGHAGGMSSDEFANLIMEYMNRRQRPALSF